MIEHRVHTAVSVQPVQGAGAATLIDGHRACPEAANRIAFAVVHTLVWTIGFDVRDPAREARAGIEADEAIAHGEQQIAGGGEGDRTHHRADPKRARRAGLGIEAMHETEFDVDEIETRATGSQTGPSPSSAFASSMHSMIMWRT